MIKQAVQRVEQATMNMASSKFEDPYLKYVFQEWILADKDKSGRLNFSEIERLLKKLNCKMKSSVIRQKFDEADTDRNGELEFLEFAAFLRDLRTRNELKKLFEIYAKNKAYLAPPDFLEFLQKEQKETTATLARATALITKFSRDQPQMSFICFSEYISSFVDNNLFNPLHETVYQDMKQPLTSYFIASSHNTYVMAHQLKGEASVEAYRSAFLRGCRCVELDCWDGENGEPIITHGHTIMSKIPFRDVIQVIKESAFKASPYPVILSIENHCSVEQQLIMSKIIKDILGSAGMLTDSFQLKQIKPLPSPESLKNKILIKGKVFSSAPADQFEEESSEDEDDDSVDEEMEFISPRTQGGKPPKEKEKEKEKQKEKEKEKDKKKEKEGKDKDKDKGKEKKKKKAHPVHKDLSDITHLKTTPFGFDKAKGAAGPWEMFSISEKKVKKLNIAQLIAYNVHQFSRIYPKGTRFDSSNYNPTLPWVGGSQLVALNYQTASIPMFLNDGKFLDNGRSGYLLKPSAVMKHGEKVNPVKFTLRIISGWQLPKPSYTTKGEIIDPYVKVRIYGVEADKTAYKTKVIANNGFNPTWDESVKCQVTRPDVAILLFTVYDQDNLSKDDFISYAALPVTSIRAGYRTLPLLTGHSVPLDESSLLVQVTFA